MSFDAGAFLLEAVPFTKTLGLVYDKVDAEVAICRLPDRPEHRNHVGGPHAGALFTLAESASGAVTLAAFGDQLSRATPLPTTSTIRFLKIAKGEVTAEARLLATRDEVVARLDTGERPEFEVAVEIRNAEGVVVSEQTVTWTLRPNRP